MSVYDKEHLYLNFLTKIFQKSSSIPHINKTVIFPQMSTQYLRFSPRIWCQYGTSNPLEFFSEVPQKRKSDGDSKKIYEHKRKRGFIDSWSKKFDGLQDSSDGMICTYCYKTIEFEYFNLINNTNTSIQYKFS